MEFLDTRDIHTLARGEPAPGLSEAEQAMVAFARQVARDATRVTADQVQELRNHGFSDPEIFEIAATAAGRALLSHFGRVKTLAFRRQLQRVGLRR